MNLIYTSYYSRTNLLYDLVYKLNKKDAENLNIISIAGKTPEWFTGKEYKKLAPKYEWWIQWKNEKLSKEWYKEKYYETVLNKLNPREVYDELGEDAILVCWEKEGFCHRHLVAEWLNLSLGVIVKEIDDIQIIIK